MKKRVCIISLALPIEVDPRTSRQAEYLAREYDVTLIGFGAPFQRNNVTWKPINRHVSSIRRIIELLLLFLGRFLPSFYEIWLRTRPRYQQALAFALESHAEVFHASDWATLYVAGEAARQTGALVVIDNDEYWPRFEETNRLWMIFFSPFVNYVLSKYADDVDAAITVSPPFAERYKQEYGYDSILIYNVPEYETTVDHVIIHDHIRLVHHGSALRNRHLETLIDMMPLLDTRFTLDLMLAHSEPGYLEELKARAAQVAPNRIFFRDSVKLNEVVQTIADCDIGLCYMAPTTYTWLMTLPNKLFEFIVAGLAVVTGPSPAMADIVNQYAVGWVAAGFQPQDLADTMNALTVEEIEAAREKTREAAKLLNAEVELGKLLALYEKLLSHDYATRS